MNRKLLLCFSLFVLMLPVSFSFAGDIKCFVLVPPEQTLEGVKQIAILDFSGDYESGRALTDYMISALLDEHRGITAVSGGLFRSKKTGVTYQKGARTNVFTLVERSRISAVLEEQKFSISGLIDDTQAASLGKILGVDAVIIGSVTPNVDEKRTREQLSFYDSGSKQWYKAMGTCIRRKVTVSARIRLVDVNTGQIIGTKEASRRMEKKKCEPELDKLPTVASMKDACLRALGYEDLVNYFNPRFTLSEFDLEKIKLKQFKSIGKQAKNLAKEGDLDKAYLLYMSILKEDEYNYAVQYNVGVLEEVVGNFEEARSAYEIAYSLKSNKKFKKAMNRAATSAAYWEKLGELGVQLEKYTFEAGEEAMAEATAVKVALKGGLGDRIKLYESADFSSSVVTKVPGGIALQWLGDKGNWVQVKTVKGQVGFISRKKVKSIVGKR